MVRAAASGVIDYTRADPKDINWKVRHRLLIHEMQRKEECQLLDVVHRHWLTYVLKPTLTQESAQTAKKRANETLQSFQEAVFPWWAQEGDKPEKDTINETNEIVERYRQFQETLKQQNQENG